MHTFWMIGGGILLLGVFVLFSWVRDVDAASLSFAVKEFVPVLLVVSLANMRGGVFRGSYAVQDELRVLLMVFGMACVVAAMAAALFFARDPVRS